MSYEWLLIPAIGTGLLATFVPRAAVHRGITVAPLALLAMTLSMLFTTTLGFLHAPQQTLQQLADPLQLLTALIGGAAGGFGLCFTFNALRHGATGPVTTIASASILMPIIAGVALKWDESPSAINIAGIVLAVAGIIVIHLGKAPSREGEKYHWLPLAIGALVCFGVSQTAQKYISHIRPQAKDVPQYGFMIAYYIAAAAMLGGFVVWTKQRPQLRALPFAFGQAIASTVQFLCMLPLLQHVATSRVYITFNGGAILLVFLISSLVLHERYKRAVWLGCVLSVAGILLVRYQPSKLETPTTAPDVISTSW